MQYLNNFKQIILFLPKESTVSFYDPFFMIPSVYSPSNIRKQVYHIPFQNAVINKT